MATLCMASVSLQFKQPRGAAMSSLQDAAKQTVDFFVKDNMLLGLGTGVASSFAVSYIGKKLKDGTLRDVKGLPMSSFSATEAAKAGLPVLPYELGRLPELDFAFDDADIVQEGTLYAILGRRGVLGRESILKEKKIARAAKQLVFILEETQFVTQLEGAVPVIIKRENWLETAEEIDDLFLGDAEVWRRPSQGEANPMGGDFPLITADGHYVLDIMFEGPIANPVEVAGALEEVPGVVTHGILHDIAYGAAISGESGVKIRTSLFKDAFA